MRCWPCCLRTPCVPTALRPTRRLRSSSTRPSPRTTCGCCARWWTRRFAAGREKKLSTCSATSPSSAATSQRPSSGGACCCRPGWSRAIHRPPFSFITPIRKPIPPGRGPRCCWRGCSPAPTAGPIIWRLTARSSARPRVRWPAGAAATPTSCARSPPSATPTRRRRRPPGRPSAATRRAAGSPSRRRAGWKSSARCAGPPTSGSTASRIVGRWTRTRFTTAAPARSWPTVRWLSSRSSPTARQSSPTPDTSPPTTCAPGRSRTGMTPFGATAATAASIRT